MRSASIASIGKAKQTFVIPFAVFCVVSFPERLRAAEQLVCITQAVHRVHLSTRPDARLDGVANPKGRTCGLIILVRPPHGYVLVSYNGVFGVVHRAELESDRRIVRKSSRKAVSKQANTPPQIKAKGAPDAGERQFREVLAK